MKFKIFQKILVAMFVVSIIPVALIGFFAANDASSLGYKSVEDAKKMGENVLADSTKALNELGQEVIKQKAIDVAKQVEIYLKLNPAKTIADLQADEYFSSIAVQPVGKTGYTAILDAQTLYTYFHSNAKLVNTDLHLLEEKLPEFWEVISKSVGGNETAGYYNWLEANGTIKQKYMYITVVPVLSGDGKQLLIAATTYIEEFNTPVNNTRTKINSSLDMTVQNIKESTEGIGIENTIFYITILTIFIVVLTSIFFSRTISQPIIDLTKATDKITNGDFDTELPRIKSKDEILDLAASIEMLIHVLRSKLK